ncbi:MAG: quinoprotein dehydrogenase-associated putative ABC transporter substrate-binding protein [Massilia sp.]|nr:quinoprotein dehydrogenase-associated putative ABC transporter substrate-binding protein [Massilia sp.]
MSLRCLDALCGVLCAFAAAGARGADAPPLRVCADPDNPPYSQRDGSGFENRIARLVADELHRPLDYFWQEQGRGFVRKTLGAGACDVFIGVPAGFDKVLRTQPYYRSTYVAVTRRADAPFAGFAPEQLRSRRFGVQLIGNDMAASPPGQALARGGATANVTGFLIRGDGPAARRMVDAVASQAIDVALVWGPQAGYFVRHASAPLVLAPVAAPAGLPVPFDYAIAMGVRKGDMALRDQLDDVLRRRRADIDAILADYAVPRTDVPTASGGMP